MAHDREFWVRQVERWRASGLSQAAYARRHGLTKGSLGCWASKLKRPPAASAAMVEIGRASVARPQRSSPIQLVVQRRYLLRLWPGIETAHLRELLDVLESRG